MNEKELIILSTLASYVPEKGSILEVGSFLGRSTSALFNGKKQSVSLDIVDTFLCYPLMVDVNNPNRNATFERAALNGNSEMFYTARDIAMKAGWLDAFKYCVGEEIVNSINIHQTSSKNFNKEKRYNLTFIDASHTEEDVLFDINKYISDSDLLLGDDYHPLYNGVPSALNQTRKNRTLIVFENTKLWALIPTTGYWKDVFKNNNLLFID